MKYSISAETAWMHLGIDIANEIARAMDRGRHPQKQLAKIAKYAGITRDQMREVMQGDLKDLTLYQLLRVARFLGCQAHVFLVDYSVDEWAVHRAVRDLQPKATCE